MRMKWGIIAGVLGGIAAAEAGGSAYFYRRTMMRYNAKKERTMKTWQTAVGYSCALSRRTTVYTGGDWIRSDYSTEHEADHPGAIENIYEFTVGLVHRF